MYLVVLDTLARYYYYCDAAVSARICLLFCQEALLLRVCVVEGVYTRAAFVGTYKGVKLNGESFG